MISSITATIFHQGIFIFLELDICYFRKIRFDFNLYIITRSFDGLYLKKKCRIVSSLKAQQKLNIFNHIERRMGNHQTREKLIMKSVIPLIQL